MEKIAVSVRIPALDTNHDFIIPSTMKMSDVKQLVFDILYSEYGMNSSTDNMVFIDKADGKALRLDASLGEMNIGDGAKLILL